jgi:hypothetical protein
MGLVMKKQFFIGAVFVASSGLGISTGEASPKCPPQQVELCHELQVILDHAQRDGILAPAEIKWDGEHLYFDESGAIAKYGQFALDMTLNSKAGPQSIDFSGSTPGKDYFQELVQFVGKQISDGNQMLGAYGYKIDSFDLSFTNVTTGKSQVGPSDHLQDQYTTLSKTYSSADALAEYNAHQAAVAIKRAEKRSRESGSQKLVSEGTIQVPIKAGTGSKDRGALSTAQTSGSVQKAPPLPRDRNGLNQQAQTPSAPNPSNAAPPIVNAYKVPLPSKGAGKQDGPPVTHAVAPPGGQTPDPVQKAPPLPRDRNGLNQQAQTPSAPNPSNMAPPVVNAYKVPAAVLLPAHTATNLQSHQQVGLLVDRHKTSLQKKLHAPDAVSVSVTNMHHGNKIIDRNNLHQHFIPPKAGGAREHNERAYLVDSERKTWSCSISGLAARALKSQDGVSNLHGHIETLHFQRNSIAHVPANHPMSQGCLVAVHK